ncbi:MAG TPA: HEAT repeat domain-containing protein [Bryobacteraceae bacterium]|nr:HEAT repeat domain-containing protein [Bryobacteraceae bacterium]
MDSLTRRASRRPGRGWTLLALLLLSVPLAAQDDAKQRAKAVRELGKNASSGTISKLEPYLADVDVDVRREAVKAIVDIGTPESVDPLVKACADNDPEIQIRAADGLVNFYLPGYIKTGMTASLRRVGTSIKGKFTDTNDQVVDAYIQVRPEIGQALGRVARGGSSMDARANAARAAGILRAREAVPDLEQALRSKDTQVIYESLVALEKIRDPSAGPSVAFLLNDLNEKVQVAAIETTGLLENREADNELRGILDRSKNMKVKRAALTALAQMPDQPLHGVYAAYLANKDEGLREAAAEGLARLKNPDDRPSAENAFSNEEKTGPRLALAFALVALGKRDTGQYDPLRYLVNNLNSAAYRGTARPYLIELARDAEVRSALYPLLQEATVTRDEKTGLAQVFAASGGQDSIAPLETLSKDSDNDVSQEAFRSLKNLRARLP